MIADRALTEVDWERPVDLADLYGRMTHIFPCAECGRLWIFSDGFEAEPRSYLPEGPGGDPAVG